MEKRVYPKWINVQVLGLCCGLCCVKRNHQMPRISLCTSKGCCQYWKKSWEKIGLFLKSWNIKIFKCKLKYQNVRKISKCEGWDASKNQNQTKTTNISKMSKNINQYYLDQKYITLYCYVHWIWFLKPTYFFKISWENLGWIKKYFVLHFWKMK